MRSIVAQKSQPTLFAALRQLGTVTVAIDDTLGTVCRMVPSRNAIVINPALLDATDLDGQLLQYIDAAVKQLAPRPNLTAVTGDAQLGEPTARPALRLVRG